MELPDRSQARSWEGKDVVDRDGQRLGRCVGVFADTATGMPEWLHVDVEGHVRSFVPALEAAESDGDVRVRFTREAVLGAPSVGDDEQLSKAEEIDLYRHYGVPVESGDGSVLPAADASADAAAPERTSTTAPVVGTSDRTSTAAAASSGAETSVAQTDAVGDDPADARMGDTTALTPTSATSGGGPADAGTVSGAAVTPVTGEQLPVLDPAAASTPVPEDQVTYVDEPETFTDEPVRDAAPETPPAAAPPAPEQPRPALRRVPPASPPPPAPVPTPSSSSSSGGDLSALTPLGAVAGVAAAVALVLRARERRQRRRTSPAARAGRLGGALRASAGSTLAGVSDAAELTRRSAATAAGKAAQAAARQQEKAAAASRRSRSQTASALTAASKTAAQQKRSAARRAAAQRKAAKASLTAAAKAAAVQRRAAAASLTAASSRSTSAAAVPRKVAKRGRKARKSLARKLWNTVVLGTAGGGYVLGAKAGRQRYDELAQVAEAVAGSPQVQAATEAVTDPERRSDLLSELQQQASSLVGRRGEPRT